MKEFKKGSADVVFALDPKTLSLKCISVFFSVVCCVFIPSTAIENKDFKTERKLWLLFYPLPLLLLASSNFFKDEDDDFLVNLRFSP